MTTYSMAVYNRSLGSDGIWRPKGRHNAVWVQTGALNVSGDTVTAGNGCYVQGGAEVTVDGTESAKVLHLEIMSAPLAKDGNPILAADFEWAETDAVLRLDQVTFPPGACAWRHVHPGPGIRYLVEGQLEIQSDHTTETMTRRSAWFEDADNPVQATAGTTQSAFVRAMILPVEYEGKPTLRYLNADDNLKPRLQTNRRFFDQKLCLRAD